ncbi:MAG: hypothetical protein OEW15_16410 [Nitrospirota bacterium]|nr:hypothetical protein [Nitrospirota bacterium]
MICSYKKWKLDYEFEKNRNFYKGISIPPPAELPNSDTDDNFAAVKSKIYPQEIIDLYEKLGIDIQKEVYLVHTARKEPGFHYYSVAHVCFGKVLAGHKSFTNSLRKLVGLPKVERGESVDNACGILISPVIYLPIEPSVGDDPASDAFQIELIVTAPWVLKNIPEPTYG